MASEVAALAQDAPASAARRGPLAGVARLLLTLVLTFLGLTFVTFAIGRLIPIDPVIAIAGDRAPVEVYERVRLELGLDRPILVQYLDYLGKILQGDFGRSVFSTRPVLQDLLEVFPATFELSTVAILVATLLGVPMGVWAASRPGRWPDHLVRVIGLVGYSVPVFWLGLIGLLVLYGQLGWVAGTGRLDVEYDGLVEPVTGLLLVDSLLAGDTAVFRNALAHLVLPAGILAAFSLAYIARMTRSFMLSALSQDYVLTARAKGLSERRVIWGHAFANVRIQVITVVALAYGYLLEGAVLTETVFAWPGLGSYMKNSLFNADMNAVLGGTLLIGTVFIVLNLLSDHAYRALDARTR